MIKDRVIQTMIGRVPEQRLWRELQDVIAAGRELDDTTIERLDSQMQGFLFLQEHVSNRRARIAFARSKQHMPYLRDAAGGSLDREPIDQQAGKSLCGIEEGKRSHCSCLSQTLQDALYGLEIAHSVWAMGQTGYGVLLLHRGDIAQRTDTSLQ